MSSQEDRKVSPFFLTLWITGPLSFLIGLVIGSERAANNIAQENIDGTHDLFNDED